MSVFRTSRKLSVTPESVFLGISQQAASTEADSGDTVEVLTPPTGSDNSIPVEIPQGAQNPEPTPVPLPQGL